MTEIHVNIWDDFEEYNSSYMYIDEQKVGMEISLEVLTAIKNLIIEKLPHIKTIGDIRLNEWGGDYYIMDLNEFAYSSVEEIVELFEVPHVVCGYTIIMYSES